MGVRFRTTNYFLYFAVLQSTRLFCMAQQVIIAVLFMAAVAYLAYLIFKNFRASGCPSGCGSCGIDFNKIRKDLQNKSIK